MALKIVPSHEPTPLTCWLHEISQSPFIGQYIVLPLHSSDKQLMTQSSFSLQMIGSEHEFVSSQVITLAKEQSMILFDYEI